MVPLCSASPAIDGAHWVVCLCKEPETAVFSDRLRCTASCIEKTLPPCNFISASFIVHNKKKSFSIAVDCASCFCSVAVNAYSAIE